MANEYYKSQFDTYVTVLEAYAGGINIPPALVDDKLRELHPSISDLKNTIPNMREEATEAANEQHLACMILVGTNNAKFGELKDDLYNRYLLGDNQYLNNM